MRLGDDSPVWVVATVRSEFLSTAPERAGLAEVVDDTLVIEPLSRARLPIVIQQPAQRAGLQFAPGLVEQMVEETTGGDALPLLAYMLRELYQQAGADGSVTVAEYEALGGVIGALQSRADRLTEELGRRGRGESVLPTLTKFAVVEGDAEPTSRRIRRSALGPDEQAGSRCVCGGASAYQQRGRRRGDGRGGGARGAAPAVADHFAKRSRPPAPHCACAQTWSGWRRIGIWADVTTPICYAEHDCPNSTNGLLITAAKLGR